VAQAIFPTPVEPARGRGLLGFDVGVAVTGVPVDDNAAYWVRSVNSNFLRSGYLAVPRLVASKGIGFANVAASYAQISGTGIKLYGGSVDVPIIDGGLVSPTLAVRGSYSEIRGVDVFSLKSYGAEAFLSKGFGPVTPYAAAGVTRFQSHGRVEQGTVNLDLSDRSDHSRVTVGLRFSLFVPKIVVEATQGEERTYSAKISLGL